MTHLFIVFDIMKFALNLHVKFVTYLLFLWMQQILQFPFRLYKKNTNILKSKFTLFSDNRQHNCFGVFCHVNQEFSCGVQLTKSDLRYVKKTLYRYRAKNLRLEIARIAYLYLYEPSTMVMFRNYRLGYNSRLKIVLSC